MSMRNGWKSGVVCWILLAGLSQGNSLPEARAGMRSGENPVNAIPQSLGAPPCTYQQDLAVRLQDLSLTARSATDSDRESVLKFITRVRDEYGYDPSKVEGVAVPDADLHKIGENYDGVQGKFILVENGEGEIMGSAACGKLREGVCELRKVYLDSSLRGKGLGKKLAATLIEHARGQGYARMELDTGSNMTDAIRLYESLGFKLFLRRAAQPADDLYYFLDLSASDGGRDRPFSPADSGP